jgi:hypothetical protein
MSFLRYCPLTALLILSAPLCAADPTINDILVRIGEEVEVFLSKARNIVGQELLDHKGRAEAPRFRLRVGKAAQEAPPLRYLTRQVQSEYGFSSFKEKPDVLHEFRKVVAVDGRRVVDASKARQTLAVNMRSQDDRELRRMLQEFQRFGTATANTDFGLMLLLFHPRALASFEFSVARHANLGAEPAIVLSYRQKPSEEGLNVYQGRELVRVPMQGEIWVRRDGLVPVRISMEATSVIDNRKAVHAAIVDYTMSARGVLLPATVHYTETVDKVLMTEDRYRYSDYRFFTAETEVKFTPVDEPPPPPK